MSTRRKFFIVLNLIAICIAIFSYAAYRYTPSQYKAHGATVEMQLVPIKTMTLDTSSNCAPSCVITSRSELGLSK